MHEAHVSVILEKAEMTKRVSKHNFDHVSQIVEPPSTAVKITKEERR